MATGTSFRVSISQQDSEYLESWKTKHWFTLPVTSDGTLVAKDAGHGCLLHAEDRLGDGDYLLEEKWA
jgi:hypothetical protein